MAAGALGKAYIEVHADTKPFSRELMKELKVILKAAQKEADKFGKGFGKQVGDSLAVEMRGQGRRATRILADEVDKVKIRKKIDIDVDGATAGRNASTLLQGLTSSITGGLSSASNTAGRAVSGLVGAMGSLVSAINPVMVIIIALVTLLAVALVGALTLVISALNQLLGLVGLLPGALGVLLAVIFPLVAAFEGFGEAVSAVIDGDPEKIAEALKKLSPAARQVVLELQTLMPLFGTLRNAAQELFFYPMQGLLSRLGRVLGPTLLTGFAAVARAAGLFAAKLAYAFSTPGAVTLFSTMFSTAAKVITTLTDPVIRVVAAFGSMATKSAPFLERLAVTFGDLMNQFAMWILKSIEDGTFEKWLQTAIEMASLMWNIFKEVGEFLRIVFTETGPEAKEFMATILDYMGQFNEYLKSEDGKQFFQGLIALGWAFLAVLGLVLAMIVKVIESIGWMIQQYNALALSSAGQALGLSPYFRSVTPSGQDHDEFNRRPGAGGHADGGIVTRETLSWLGEGDKPEVVIPLTKPARARQLMAESGLMGMSGGGDVYVYIGNEQLDSRMFRVANSAMGSQALALASGPRGEV